jgi:acyl-CoA thioester hydrolase
MFKYDFNIRGYELDSNGHANHANYLNYFEQARWELVREAGLFSYIKENGLSIIVIEINVRYSREVNMFDELIIRTDVTEEPPYLLFRQKMYFRDSGLKASQASVKVVFTEEGRLVRDIPSEITDKLCRSGKT